MAWPEWIEELKERYLADEASAFLLYGNVTGTTWRVGDQDLDCVGVLRAFLTPTRQVVGVLHPWPPPSRLEFAGIADRTTFENLVKAYELVEGRTDALTESTPEHAIARIWRALGTAGTPRILPGHRKRIEPLPGAPSLFEWPSHPRLRRSNNLLVFLTHDRDAVRTELATATCAIHVDVEAIEPIEQVVAFQHLEEEVPDAPVVAEVQVEDSDEVAAPPPLPPAAPAAATDDLRSELEHALVHALIEHPEDARCGSR